MRGCNAPLFWCNLVLCRYWTHFYVDPSENFHYRWLSLVSMAVLYNIIFIIVRAVFSELQTSYVTVWLVLDYLCDLIYVMDMGIQFRTGMSWTRASSLGQVFQRQGHPHPVTMFVWMTEKWSKRDEKQSYRQSGHRMKWRQRRTSVSTEHHLDTNEENLVHSHVDCNFLHTKMSLGR